MFLILLQLMMRPILLIFFLFFTIILMAEDDLIVIKDLKPEWLINQNSKYQPYDFTISKSIQSIFFPVSSEIYRHNYLLVECLQSFSVFLNGNLIADYQKEFLAPVDSLIKKSQSQQLFLSIHFDHPVQTNVKTAIVAQLPPYSVLSNGPIPKHENQLLNFAILATLILLIFFATILATNPRQIAHYFSFFNLFSFRESDENQVFNKLTSSLNIVFYIFSSMVCGFVLLMIWSGLSSDFSLASYSVNSGFLDLMIGWLKLSGLLFFILLVKAATILLFGGLFGISDLSGLQFVNFIRVFLLSMILLSFIVVIYFILGGKGELFYSVLYKSILWVMIGWIILSFLKLMRRVHFSGFQLFSYICATEIIPSLLAIKILYE